jgi:hypothetical protein
MLQLQGAVNAAAAAIVQQNWHNTVLDCSS